MATHSSILVGKNLKDRGTRWATVRGVEKRVRHGGAHTHGLIYSNYNVKKKREMEDEPMTLKKHVAETNTTL